MIQKTVQGVKESEGDKSELEVDVGRSQSLSNFINTNKISVNETRAEKKTSHVMYVTMVP